MVSSTTFLLVEANDHVGGGQVCSLGFLPVFRSLSSLLCGGFARHA